MRRSAAVGVVGALVAVSAGAVGVAHANDGSSPSDARVQVVVRHLQDRNPVNTDLDLGKPGPSIGNMQVFTSNIVENGHRVATNAGTSQIVGATFDGTTPRTITSFLTQTYTFSNGKVVMSGTFTEDLSVGLPAFKLAVTGGTGAYRTARGELLFEIIRNSDNGRVTLTLILGR